MPINKNWVLSLYISRHSVSFLSMTKGRVLLEWGNRAIGKCKEKDKHKKSAQLAKQIIEKHRPGILILEAKSNRRTKEVWDAYAKVEKHARKLGIIVYKYSRRDIQTLFKAHGAKNKHQMNQLISPVFPPLRFDEPPERRTWDSEHYAQSQYDAASLAVVYMVKEDNLKLPSLPKESTD